MNTLERPDPGTVWKAINVFLRFAYESTPPAQVEARLERLRGCPAEQIFDSEVFERDAPDDPQRYSLRLGNRHYPHMKLVIERLSTRGRWFFRADTHDQHVALGSSHPEYEEFQRLMSRNQGIAEAIESAWQAVGVDTFRWFLQRDLEARRSAGGGH